eukprot:CAMPEP_0117524118 /NCGR_PEP_ID=MMETSP0784-20121206/35082_1 /TAXON_ID=39447 /ORGANISM="" /LENGTH=77 /DNA_ID=CAMNT_0005320259 /DNA_START=51 /DNA_END=284 /DNA_ORIENTATION=+
MRPPSEEESDDLAASVFPAGLLVRHDSIRRRQNQVPELAGRKDVACKLLDVRERDVESRRNDAALVNAADEVDDDLP